MFIFLYYKGYLEILDIDMLLELKKDINNDYEKGILEPHQFNYLEEKLQSRLNDNKIVCI